MNLFGSETYLAKVLLLLTIEGRDTSDAFLLVLVSGLFMGAKAIQRIRGKCLLMVAVR